MRIQLSDHFTYGRLLRFVYPSIIMMVFISIYGIVDGLFISNFVGETPFASVNFIMPFIMFLGGMGFMIGTGGTALASKLMGEGKKEKANRCFSMMAIVALILGISLAIIGNIFIRKISYFLGATDDMIDICVLYGRIIIGFTPAYIMQSIFHSFSIAAEKPKLGLIATIAAGVTNMALDALFIVVFKWGVAGAAIATGLSQCIGALIPFIYFMHPNSSLYRLVKAKIEWPLVLKACTNGSSELMSNISNSIVGMLYNFQLLRLAGEDGVAAYAVLMYVQFIFIAIYIGYAIGCAPITGYHYGAQNHSELKNILKKSTILMGSLGVVLTATAIALSETFAKIFIGYNAELCELTVHAFRLFSFAFILSGFNIFASSFFTALNNGAVSAAISFLRTLLFQSGSVLILPLIFDVDGVWLAVTVAEVFACIISVIFLFAMRKKYKYM